ncbi:MAG: Hsp20/alpha crystallin family protein [Candidatus Bilamarchaeaceae archaeon]
MEKRNRRSPFGDDFFNIGFGDMDEIFGRMREDMEKMMERGMSSLSEQDIEKLSRNPNARVHGFSIRVGPDGKPVVREFGNMKGGAVTEAGDGTANHSRPGASEPGSSREEGAGNRKPSSDEREPLVDVLEGKDNVVVVAEVPGVSEHDISLKFQKDGSLEISAPSGERKYFKRLELPKGVAHEKMKRSYKNGVLELVFPRR